jgi:hypothetical protein
VRMPSIKRTFFSPHEPARDRRHPSRWLDSATNGQPPSKPPGRMGRPAQSRAARGPARRYHDAVAIGHHHQPAPRLGPRQPPGYNLAKRPHDKASQIWPLGSNFKILWTNNASEQALKGLK